MKNILFSFVAVLLTTSFALTITASVNDTINRKSPVQLEINISGNGEMFFEESSGLFLFMTITKRQHFFNRKYIRLPQAVVEYGVANKRERLVAYFGKLKRVYHSGTFINRAVPQGIYVSRKTHQQYVNQLIGCGFAKVVGNGFQLLSCEKIAFNIQGDNSRKRIYETKNVKDTGIVVKELRLLVFNNKQKQQKHRIREKRNSSFNSERVNTTLNKTWSDYYSHESSDNLAIGYHSIGTTINRSATTAFRLMNYGQETNQFQKITKKRERLYKKVNYYFFEQLQATDRQKRKLVYDFLSHNVYACYPNIYRSIDSRHIAELNDFKNYTNN